MRSLLLASVLLTALVGKVKGQECDIVCHDSYACVKNEADFGDHPTLPNGAPLPFLSVTASENGYHCDCPPGKTGLRCGRSYESCNSTDVRFGNHRCYHGGQCIPGQPDEFSNEQYFCDCNKAEDLNGTTYVGKYCELPIRSNSTGFLDSVTPCDDDGDFFCMNDKECKEDYASSPRVPCRCGQDFEGPHCEFPKGAVPECNMTCEQGHCKLGIKSYEQAALGYGLFWDNQLHSMHCECPDGLFGPRCEISSEVCNDHHCFHGAKCVEIKHRNGTSTSGCDCTTATQEGVVYGGQYCQYRATAYCDSNSEDENGQAVCFNGGNCTSEGPHAACACNEPFHGPRCEFHSALDIAGSGWAKCSLDCGNTGGVCRKGVKDKSFLSKWGADMSHLINRTNAAFGFEHCVCPEGRVGVKCEIEVEECENSDHICLNGATCKVTNGNPTCDCDDAHSSLSGFAGIFCQHESTDICTTDGKLAGRNKLAFCVNGGTCNGTALADERSHPGCDCPDEFEGIHCELRVGSLAATLPPGDGGGGGSKNKGMIAFVSVACFVVVVLSLLVWHRVRSTRKEIDTGDGTGITQTTAAPVVDVGPEKDFDGNELENVEII